MLRKWQISSSNPTPEEMGSHCWLGLGLQVFGHCIFWQGFLQPDFWLAVCVGVVSLSMLLVSISPAAGSGDLLVSCWTWQLPRTPVFMTIKQIFAQVLWEKPWKYDPVRKNQKPIKIIWNTFLIKNLMVMCLQDWKYCFMAEGRNSSIYTSLSSSIAGFHRSCRDNLVQVLGWCKLAELSRLHRGWAKLYCFRSQEIIIMT